MKNRLGCSRWLPSIRSFLVVAATLLVFPRTQAQGWTPVINVTNHVWKYLVDGGDQGTAWREPGFNDDSWPSGIGLFGFESTPAVYPHPFQTIWPLMDGRLTYYARTHFQWDGPLNWGDVLLRTINYIDDGAVFYLDGVEVGRVRITNDVVNFDTPAQSPFVEGQPDILEFRVPFLLRDGDHVLAVEIHNANPVSHDIVFGLSMTGIECHFDFVADVSPMSQTVEQCRPATISRAYPTLYRFGLRWLKNGVPIPDATNEVLHIPQVVLSDVGYYALEVLTPCGPQQGPASRLVIVPDSTPPQPLRAVVDSGLTNLIVTFSEPLDAASIDATNFIVDDVCLPGRLKTQTAILVNPTNVLVTTTPRRIDQNYVVTVSGIRDACVGNVQSTNVTVQLNPTVPLSSLGLLHTSGGLQLSWIGCGVLQWASNLVQWVDVPGNPASPYLVDELAQTRFFRLRLP